MGRYILIEGGEALARVQEVRAEADAANEAYAAWAAKYGCTGWYGPGNGGRPSGLPSCPNPDTWKKEKRGGYYSPRKSTAAGKAVAEEMAALPPDPTDTGFMGNDLAAEILGWTPGNLRGPLFLWAGETTVIYLPSKDVMGFERPDDLKRLVAFKPPEGCREITKAEWDLIVAEFRVSQEERQKAAGGAA